MGLQEIRSLLKALAASAPGKVQLRYHRRRTRSVAFENGLLRDATSSVLAGVAIRVLAGGAWGFAATADVSKPSLEKSLAEALDAAEAGRKRRPETPAFATRPAVGEFAVRQTRPFESVSLEEKLELVRSSEAAVRSSHSRITSASSGFTEWLDDKVIVTSDGADAVFTDAKADFRVGAVAQDGSEMETGSVRIGCTGGWGELFRRLRPEELPARAAKSAVEKLGAESPAGGMATVILDPALVGVLAHEAIGHTVEADFVLAGSIVKGKLGRKVAAERVTLVDDPNPESDQGAAGILLVDDEGTLPSRTALIENGILKGYLHDTETAAAFGVQPTGSARAFTYRDEPLIRMTNTCILPGDCPLERMIAETPDGLYCRDLGLGGQADANAEFMFDVDEAWKIEGGKLTKRLKGVTIAGQAFDVLSSVDLVGNDFLFDLGAGFCGKHQPAKVDSGGPHLRCRMKIGGRL